ncbi:MAG TPA: GGDEF domain-containing protein [Gaiellaceae bacterium]|jgi:diguanylate cyclase (GGDEF)-like protein|nr:GGDEF domain-containing protein [Gaiellaceae bacterium]
MSETADRRESRGPAPEGRAELLERLRVQEGELERLMREDDLTRLFNRRFARRLLIARLGGATRHDTPVSVARIDIDHFKLVNSIARDYRAGDEVLRRVAQILRGSAREDDVVGRWGGDEFVLVLPRTPREEAAAACRRLLAAVSRENWDAIHPRIRVTLSAGVSDRADADSADGLVAAADARLEQAKADGGNRVAS